MIFSYLCAFSMTNTPGPFAASPTQSSNAILQNFAQHLQTNGTTNMPAATLKYLQNLPPLTQPSPFTPPHAFAAPGSPNPLQDTNGQGQSQQHQWQPNFFQSQGNNQAWWRAHCSLRHQNPISKACRQCGCPRDPHQAQFATQQQQQQQKGKGKGKGAKGKGKGKQQTQTSPTQDQLMKEDGTIVWDPAGWVRVA